MGRSVSNAERAALARLLDLAGEREARLILSDLVQPALLAEFERVATCAVAYRLMEARAPRPVIRARLMARGVSERSAYRAIDAILGQGSRSSATVAGTVAEGVDKLAAPSDAETSRP